MKDMIMPNGYYLSVDLYNYLNDESARLTIIAEKDDKINISSYDIPLIDDYASPQTLSIPIGGISLQHCSCILTAAVANNGFCYCVMSIKKGIGEAANRLAILGNGYINHTVSVNYPFTGDKGLDPVSNSIVRVEDAPAPGDPSNLIVPPFMYYRVLGLKAQLVTSAVAVNRYPFLNLYDPNDFLSGGFTIETSILASENKPIYGYKAGTTWNFRSTGQFIQVPDIWLSAGWYFRFGMIGMDADDTWTHVRWLVEKKLCF